MMIRVDLLQSAIIQQAAIDYRECARKHDAGGMLECERFFKSDWFVDLSMGHMDGEVLFNNLARECKKENSNPYTDFLQAMA